MSFFLCVTLAYRRPDTDSDPANQHARNLNVGAHQFYKVCEALSWYLIPTEINNI